MNESQNPEIEKLRAENETLRNAQKACEDCDGPTLEEVKQLRAENAELRKDKARLDWLERHIYKLSAVKWSVEHGAPLRDAIEVQM